MNQLDPTNEFDVQLTQALRPVDPPSGFAAQVMERAAQPAARTPAPAAARRFTVSRWLQSAFRLPSAPLWTGGALAAALVACLFTGEQLHHRRQQQAADQQFLTAVRVTDHALDHARAQILRAGIKLSD